MTIGYDTENKVLTTVKTVNDVSFVDMFNICINNLIKHHDVEKYKKVLLNVAEDLDKKEG